MKKSNLFYMCDDIGSVFDSQVLSLLLNISEKKYFKKLYLLLGISDDNRKNKLTQIMLESDIEVVFFKSFPNYPFFNSLNRRSISSAINGINIQLNDVLFHTRGEMMAYHLGKILDKKYHKNIIPDVRGASVEEIREYYNYSKPVKYLKILNSRHSVEYLKWFNQLSVVSDSLKDYLISNNKNDPAKICITPCLAGMQFRNDYESRQKIRNSMNLAVDDTLIVFSSGGNANWQNTDVVNKLAQKGFKVLNLSRSEHIHDNVINKFVSFAEIAAYLNAADIAIIWRDKSIVNKVASPVKFSEYVCCGLPVIANDSVDMISKYIRENECGLIIDNIDDLDKKAVNSLKLKDRQRISEEGIKTFGIETIVDKYLQLYSSTGSL